MSTPIIYICIGVLTGLLAAIAISIYGIRKMLHDTKSEIEDMKGYIEMMDTVIEYVGYNETED